MLTIVTALITGTTATPPKARRQEFTVFTIETKATILAIWKQNQREILSA
jgi:hypothetical protein